MLAGTHDCHCCNRKCTEQGCDEFNECKRKRPCLRCNPGVKDKESSSHCSCGGGGYICPNH